MIVTNMSNATSIATSGGYAAAKQKSTGNSLTLSNITANAGEVIVIAITNKNTTNIDGESREVSSVTIGSTQFTYAYSWGSGTSAGNGPNLEFWYLHTGNTAYSNETVTISWSANSSVRIAYLQRFTLSNVNSVSVSKTAGDFIEKNATALTVPSISLTFGANDAQTALLFYAFGMDRDLSTEDISIDASYTRQYSVLINLTTTGGSSFSNNLIRVGWKVVSIAANSTQTVSASKPNTNWINEEQVQLFVAFKLEETPTPTPSSAFHSMFKSLVSY